MKKNIEIAHGTLVQLLTLNTTLLGGIIVFLKPEIIGKEFFWISYFFFFLSIFLSFLGVLPHESTVSTISPSEIKKHKTDVLRRKLMFMRFVAVFTGSGLLIIAIGLI